jgi:aryl-alcohol dehydrogenase-like predicted oxidoreductase
MANRTFSFAEESRTFAARICRTVHPIIDLYQFHHVDRNTPWDEIWQVIQVAIQQGKVIYAGSSNFAGWHIAQAQEAGAQREMLGLVSEQSLYNPLARTIELELIPAAEHYGLGLIPWSPLQGGVLGGRWESRRRPRAMRGRGISTGA